MPRNKPTHTHYRLIDMPTHAVSLSCNKPTPYFGSGFMCWPPGHMYPYLFDNKPMSGNKPIHIHDSLLEMLTHAVSLSCNKPNPYF